MSDQTKLATLAALAHQLEAMPWNSPSVFTGSETRSHHLRHHPHEILMPLQRSGDEKKNAFDYAATLLSFVYPRSIAELRQRTTEPEWSPELMMFLGTSSGFLVDPHVDLCHERTEPKTRTTGKNAELKAQGGRVCSTPLAAVATTGFVSVS